MGISGINRIMVNDIFRWIRNGNNEEDFRQKDRKG